MEKFIRKFTNNLDKYCILIFDEISLDPLTNYNSKLDQIIDFEDDGEIRNPIFADHALVFMVKGILRNWKQPLAFTFCHATTKTPTLTKLIQRVIRSLCEIGLKVVTTVCDQGATNRCAINLLKRKSQEHFLRLGEENRCKGFLIDDEEVVPLFDPPHLLKGIRNDLLKKDIHYKQDDKIKQASWKDIVSLYKIDTGDQSHRLCPRLTDKHVIYDKIPKMKAKYCVQIFSQRVSTIMRKLPEWGK